MFLPVTYKILIDTNVQTLNLNRPQILKLTTLEVHIQTLLILTQRHSCALNGCSWDVLTHWMEFTHTHKHSGPIQYSFKGIQVHSQALKECSILTQRHSSALTSVQGVFSSDKNENFLMITPWWVTFNNDSKVVMRSQWLFKLTHNGIPERSMGVQGVFNTHSLAFMCTQWVFRGCSQSLIGIHVHSMCVQGMFNTHYHRCSRALTSVQEEVINASSACACIRRPNEYVKTWCYTWIHDS